MAWILRAGIEVIYLHIHHSVILTKFGRYIVANDWHNQKMWSLNLVDILALIKNTRIYLILAMVGHLNAPSHTHTLCVCPGGINFGVDLIGLKGLLNFGQTCIYIIELEKRTD